MKIKQKQFKEFMESEYALMRADNVGDFGVALMKQQIFLAKLLAKNNTRKIC